MDAKKRSEPVPPKRDWFKGVMTTVVLAFIAFITTTTLRLDKNYGIMATSMESGFAHQSSTLERIESLQSKNTTLLHEHDRDIAAMKAIVDALKAKAQ